MQSQDNNIINLILDVDDLVGSPYMLRARDRAPASPVVGPGTMAGVAWMTQNQCVTKAECAKFIHIATPVLGRTLRLVSVGASPLWRGELSSHNVQLHACAAHRWMTRLRRRVGGKWCGCRCARSLTVS